MNAAVAADGVAAFQQYVRALVMVSSTSLARFDTT